MSRVEELEKQIQELDERKVALQHELELEKLKTKIEYPTFLFNEPYWIISSKGEICRSWWSDDSIDKTRYKIGNFFATEEQAEKEFKKLSLLTRFRQFRDKCNGDWKPGAFDCKYFIAYDSFKNVLESSWNDTWDNFNTFGYFYDERDCLRAIELFGDEIKRLWVEE